MNRLYCPVCKSQSISFVFPEGEAGGFIAPHDVVTPAEPTRNRKTPPRPKRAPCDGAGRRAERH